MYRQEERICKKNSSKNTSSNKNVVTKFLALYDELFAHNGYGEVRIEMRILHHDQKEIIIHCGKQYRFVVDYQPKKKRGGDAYGTERSVRGGRKGITAGKIVVGYEIGSSGELFLIKK